MKSVLYIEDDEMILELTKTILNEFISEKINLSTCGRVDDAKNILQSQKFDLLITDCTLADGKACELFSIIKKLEIPVIVTTGDLNALNDIERENLPKYIDFLYKPFNINKLIATINKYI